MKFACLAAAPAAFAPRAAFVLTLTATMAQLAGADEFWVTDRANNRVVALDADNGRFLRVIANTGMAQPTSLTEGPGGLIYVANGSLGDPEAPVAPVVVVDPLGTLGANVTNFNVGNATSEASPLLPGGILYNPANNSLLVSEFGQFNGNRVFRFGLGGGNPVQTIGAGSSTTGRTGLALHDGTLYVNSFGDFTLPPPLLGAPVGAVLKHDGANGYATFASGVGQSATVLLGASGLDFKGDGSAAYVASLVGQGLVRYAITAGVAGSPQAYGQSIAYPSGMLVTQQSNRESLLATSLGNDNPADPIYGAFTFPGQIVRYDLTTGNKVSFLVGDFNGDLTVNNADLAVWSGAAAASTTADANGDGDSDGEDFLAWQRNYGNQGVQGAFQPTAIIRHVGQTGATAVPEPGTAVSAVTCAVLIPLARRRRARV